MTDDEAPRVELPSLQGIRFQAERFYLRMYLRSNLDKDQDEARKRCQAEGIDYDTARTEAPHTMTPVALPRTTA